jgi:methionyl aminopeptidase
VPIYYKSKGEIETLRIGGKILAELLQTIAASVKPDISASILELITREEIKKAGAQPAFLNYDTGYMGKFPAALCVSVNDEIVHGIPAPKKIFKEGDLVGIDCGIWYKNLCVDAAITVPCGAITKDAQRLLTVTREALTIGIGKCRLGNCIGDIGYAIQRYVESHGFCVIKSLVGHGVGYKVHEDPQIPNFFPIDPKNPKNKGAQIKEGMTLAIEPMISISSEQTKKGKDGYAAVTKDGSLSAHFEHTVAITKRAPLILTMP